MFEPDAPTDIIMSEVGADEDNYVLAHIPGQAPRFVKLGGSIPSQAQRPSAVVPVLLGGRSPLFIFVSMMTDNAYH